MCWRCLGICFDKLHRANWPKFFKIFRHDPFWAVSNAALPRSIGKTAVAFPHQLNLPTDALIGIKVQRRLGCFIPALGWLNGFTVLRITVIPQKRPACRGDARRLCLWPGLRSKTAPESLPGPLL